MINKSSRKNSSATPNQESRRQGDSFIYVSFSDRLKDKLSTFYIIEIQKYLNGRIERSYRLSIFLLIVSQFYTIQFSLNAELFRILFGSDDSGINASTLLPSTSISTNMSYLKYVIFDSYSSSKIDILFYATLLINGLLFTGIMVKLVFHFSNTKLPSLALIALLSRCYSYIFFYPAVHTSLLLINSHSLALLNLLLSLFLEMVVSICDFDYRYVVKDYLGKRNEMRIVFTIGTKFACLLLSVFGPAQVLPVSGLAYNLSKIANYAFNHPFIHPGIQSIEFSLTVVLTQVSGILILAMSLSNDLDFIAILLLTVPLAYFLGRHAFERNQLAIFRRVASNIELSREKSGAGMRIQSVKQSYSERELDQIDLYLRHIFTNTRCDFSVERSFPNVIVLENIIAEHKIRCNSSQNTAIMFSKFDNFNSTTCFCAFDVKTAYTFLFCNQFFYLMNQHNSIEKKECVNGEDFIDDSRRKMYLEEYIQGIYEALLKQKKSTRLAQLHVNYISFLIGSVKNQTQCYRETFSMKQDSSYNFKSLFEKQQIEYLLDLISVEFDLTAQKVQTAKNGQIIEVIHFDDRLNRCLDLFRFCLKQKLKFLEVLSSHSIDLTHLERGAVNLFEKRSILRGELSRLFEINSTNPTLQRICEGFQACLTIDETFSRIQSEKLKFGKDLNTLKYYSTDSTAIYISLMLHEFGMIKKVSRNFCSIVPLRIASPHAILGKNISVLQVDELAVIHDSIMHAFLRQSSNSYSQMKSLNSLFGKDSENWAVLYNVRVQLCHLANEELGACGQLSIVNTGSMYVMTASEDTKFRLLHMTKSFYTKFFAGFLSKSETKAIRLGHLIPMLQVFLAKSKKKSATIHSDADENGIVKDKFISKTTVRSTLVPIVQPKNEHESTYYDPDQIFETVIICPTSVSNAMLSPTIQDPLLTQKIASFRLFSIRFKASIIISSSTSVNNESNTASNETLPTYYCIEILHLSLISEKDLKREAIENLKIQQMKYLEQSGSSALASSSFDESDQTSNSTPGKKRNIDGQAQKSFFANEFEWNKQTQSAEMIDFELKQPRKSMKNVQQQYNILAKLQTQKQQDKQAQRKISEIEQPMMSTDRKLEEESSRMSRSPVLSYGVPEGSPSNVNLYPPLIGGSHLSHDSLLLSPINRTQSASMIMTALSPANQEHASFLNQTAQQLQNSGRYHESKSFSSKFQFPIVPHNFKIPPAATLTSALTASGQDNQSYSLAKIQCDQSMQQANQTPQNGTEQVELSQESTDKSENDRGGQLYKFFKNTEEHKQHIQQQASSVKTGVNSRYAAKVRIARMIKGKKADRGLKAINYLGIISILIISTLNLISYIMQRSSLLNEQANLKMIEFPVKIKKFLDLMLGGHGLQQATSLGAYEFHSMEEKMMFMGILGGTNAFFYDTFRNLTWSFLQGDSESIYIFELIVQERQSLYYVNTQRFSSTNSQIYSQFESSLVFDMIYAQNLFYYMMLGKDPLRYNEIQARWNYDPIYASLDAIAKKNIDKFHEQVSKRKDLITMQLIVISIVTGVFSLFVAPVYAYSQAKREALLHLFATISFEQIAGMVAMARRFIKLSTQQQKQQQFNNNEESCGSMVLEELDAKELQTELRQHKKKTISSTNSLPRITTAILLGMLLSVSCAQFYPIIQYIQGMNSTKRFTQTVSFISSMDYLLDNVSTLMSIKQQTTALVLQEEAAEIASPNSQSELSQESGRDFVQYFIDYSKIKLGQSQSMLQDLQHWLDEYQNGDYSSDSDYLTYLVPLFQGNLCATFATKKHTNDIVTSECTFTFGGAFEKGMLISVSKFYNHLRMYFEGFWQKSASVMHETLLNLQGQMGILDEFLYQKILFTSGLSTHYFIEEMYDAELAASQDESFFLLILQLAVLSLILVFGWNRFYTKIGQDFFAAKQLLDLIEPNVLLDNSYFQSYLKQHS